MARRAITVGRAGVAAGAACLAVLAAGGPAGPAYAAEAQKGGPANGKQRAPAKGKQRGHMLIRVKAPKRVRGGVPLKLRPTRQLRRVSVRVNGRRARTDVGRHRRQRTLLALGAAARVRFGPNRVVVTAVDRRGRRQVVRRRVRVLRGAPLAGVRVPRSVQGRPVRLDARPSRASGRSGLRYRWRVVQRPARARARLLGARRARPRLRVTHPGRYALALTVAQRRRGRARAAAPGGCAVRSAPQPVATPALPSASVVGPPPASTPAGLLPASAQLETVAPTARSRPLVSPPARKAAPGCVTEIVTLDVAPNTSKLGAVLDSRAEQDGKTGIRVGASFYPVPAGRAALLVLDAKTLEDLSFATAPADLPVGVWAVEQTMRYQVSGREVLMVLSGMPGCCADDPTYPDSGFTVVQRPAESVDTIVQNRGMTLAQGDAVGQLAGYLQQGVPLDGAQPAYRFVSPERVAFDTRASATPGTNVMRVGDQTYTGALPAGASAGYQVLVLDAAQRPQLGTPTVFATNTGDATADRQQEEAMNRLAVAARGQAGTTVLVQSIGHPRPSSSAAWDLAVALEQLGGTPWMFLGLDGTGDYALVGNPPPPGTAVNPVAAAEASSQWQGGGNGDLQGVLRRRADQALYAPLADPVGTPNYGLTQVVYQAPTAWPETDTPGKVAATSYVATAVGLVPGPGSCYQPAEPDFRSSYCNESMDVDAVRDQLDDVAYPSSGTPGFTRDELAAVLKQLGVELDYVAQVRSLVTALQKPFGTAGVAPAVDSSEIAGQLVDALPVKGGSAVSGDLELASSILYVGAEVPVVGEALGPIASVLDLASVLTEQAAEPSPDWGIEAAAGELGATVERRLQAMSGGLSLFQDILVSDYGKLQTTARNAVGAWGVSGAGIDEEISTLELGIKQWLWTAILPSAFDLVKIPGVPLDQRAQAWCVYSRAPEEWRPWQKAPADSAFFPLVGWSGTEPAAPAMFGMLSGKFSDKRSDLPTAGLTRLLFASPDTAVGPGQPAPAGLVRPWLFERAEWNIQAPKMIQPDSGLVPGYCGVGDT